MRRPSLVSAGSLNRLLQTAGEAWKRCEFTESIAMMERASRLAPSHAGILLDLGRLYGLRYDYPAAERCFERAVRVAPNKTEALLAAGHQCREFNQLARAEGYLKRALEQKGVTPVALVKLGEVYERLRRTEAAVSLADRALQTDATNAPALLLRARLDRQAGRLEVAEQRLRAFPTIAEPALRASASYELGGIFDRQGRYDDAMQAFLAAKAMLQPLAGRPTYELKVMRNRLRHLMENTTTELLQSWFAMSAQLQPAHRLALLGGHPRSGTTLLEQVLDAHPDMVSAEETEIFYNDVYGPLLRGQPDDTGMYSALTTATVDTLQSARKNYFRAMESSLSQPIAGRLLIDKNPSYTFLIPALARAFPEMKFLIALRDPRDVVLSCFMQDLPLNHSGAAYLNLESTVTEYIALMGAWQTIAPRLCNPFLEVRYEAMVADLESVARKTLEFLGVPWDARVLGFDQHAREKTVRSPTYADVTQPVYKRAVGRWHHYQKYLEPQLARLEPFVKAFGYE